MKSLITIIFCLIPLATYAQSNTRTSNFVKFDLKVGMGINGVHKYSKCTRACTGRKTVVDQINKSLTAYMQNGRYERDGKVIYNVTGNVTSGMSQDDYKVLYDSSLAEYKKCMQAHEITSKKRSQRQNKNCIDPTQDTYLAQMNPSRTADHFRTLRSTSFNLGFIDGSNSSQTVKISVEDQQNHTQEDLADGYALRYSNDSISGNIRVGLKLPENTWAYIVNRKTLSGIFSGATPAGYSSPGMENSFNQGLRYNGQGQFLAWGKPNSEIYHQINFENFSQGSNLKGELVIDFIPVNFAELHSLTPKEIAIKIQEVTLNYKSVNNFQSMLSSIKPILYLHGKNDLQSLIITSLPTVEILNLIDGLNEISYSAEANIYHWDLKAASSILAHELSLLLLKELAPFCKQINIQLPYNRETIQTIGLKYASYLIERSKNRLHKTTYVHFEALLNHLKDYENKNLSYAEVRNNAKEFEKLRAASDLLSNTVNMRYSTYENIYTELKSIQDTYGTISAPGLDNAKIMEFSKNLRSIDITFYNELVGLLRNFQPNNSEKISTKSLEKALSDLNSYHLRLSNMIDERIKLTGSKTNQGDSLANSMITLISHNIDIFSKPLGDSSFELFRSQYFDSSKVNPVLNSVNGCLR